MRNWIWGVLLLAALGAGCKDSAGGSKGASANQVFQVKGVLKEVQEGGKRALIKHEEIPGFMAAMTMPFDVKNPEEVRKLGPGTPIQFRLTYNTNDMWIDQVTATGPAPPPQNPDQVGNFRRVREVEPLQVGDPIPSYNFTNELGKAVNLQDFKGTTVAFTFIFTRCPNPNFCPLMSKRFADTSAELEKSELKKWRLLSVTMDPEYDTPPRLLNYAKSYRYDPGHWSFLTGSWVDTTALGEQFGLNFYKEGDSFVINHNLRTVVIDPAGRIRHVFVGDKWSHEELVEQMLKSGKG